MRHQLILAAATTTCLLAAPGCRDEEALTLAEATEALEEAGLASEASNLVGSSVEISTNFTIGGAVEEAAGEIRNFVESQLPCADVQLESATLTIDYGVNPGNCTYKGQTYTGSHAITVSKNTEGEVVVEHVWTELENQKLSVTGSAVVTWSLANETRHVVHELEWTRKSDGRTGVGSGDRLQSLLEGGLAEGIQIDGARSWDGESGIWDLAIDGVQMRWTDPVPQAGTYTLVTPKDKELTLGFERKDEDTITVIITGPSGRSFDFDVSKWGAALVGESEE